MNKCNREKQGGKRAALLNGAVMEGCTEKMPVKQRLKEVSKAHRYPGRLVGLCKPFQQIQKVKCKPLPFKSGWKVGISCNLMTSGSLLTFREAWEP